MFGFYNSNNGKAAKVFYETLRSIKTTNTKKLLIEAASVDNDYLTFKTPNLDLCIIELESRGCKIKLKEENRIIFKDLFGGVFQVISQ